MSNLTQFTEACDDMRKNTLHVYGNTMYAAGHLNILCAKFFEYLPPEVQEKEIKNMKFYVEQHKQK